MHFLPWQTRLTDTLLSQMGTGKLPHALLFSGADGIGKLNFALTFVQRLFCKQAMGTSPCQQCDACHKFSVGTHPDVKRIFPLEGKKVIAVDQIRELINYVGLTPHSAQKKVVIIEQADLLNNNAANSLLKTLEEPPVSSMLIIVTHRPDKLLPTLRSRCQTLIFPTPDLNHATKWLTKQLKKPEEVTALLALSDGAPLKALDYAESGVLELRQQFFTDFEQMTQAKKNPLEIAKKWFKKDLDFTINCLHSWVVDIIRLKVSKNKEYLNNPDLSNRLINIANLAGLTELLDYYQSLNGVELLKKSNINSQMILENILIEWNNLSGVNN